MTRATILGMLIAVVFFSGCVVIPTGEFHQSASRKTIEKEALDFMRVGSTRKQEVLLKLGEPNMTWEEDRQFMYWMGTHQGFWLACVTSFAGAGCTGGPLANYVYFLLIEFDDYDVVKRHDFDNRTYINPFISIDAALPTIHKRLTEWSQAVQVQEE